MAAEAALLLTGQPGTGKSTVVQHVIRRLRRPAGGFYTREVRQAGRRVGFEIVTLTGETALLASRGQGPDFLRAAPYGRYTVDLDALEQVAVPALQQAREAGILVVVDEIGPMELLSPLFRQETLALLEAEQTAVLGTIVARGHEFADRVRAHPRVKLVEVTLENRDALPTQLLALLKRALS